MIQINQLKAGNNNRIMLKLEKDRKEEEIPLEKVHANNQNNEND